MNINNLTFTIPRVSRKIGLKTAAHILYIDKESIHQQSFWDFWYNYTKNIFRKISQLETHFVHNFHTLDARDTYMFLISTVNRKNSLSRNSLKK